MNQRAIEKWFRPLRRHPCWEVSYDRQLNLSMNFGRPSLQIREPYITRSKSPLIQRRASRRDVTVRGQWWLWLFCCYWQLKRHDEVLATSSASYRRIERALQELDGQKLTAVSVDWKTASTRFRFDLGSELTCRRLARDSKSDVWTLYGPGELCLSVTGAGECREEQASKTESQGKRG